MSNQLTIQDRIYALEGEFNQANAYKMNFIKEAQFALQLLQNNEGLFKVAQSNPGSLEYAILNIAAIGITLNPALREAYLIPRSGKIILDPSYIGLCKLATDTGAIEWVQAEVVKQNDEFDFLGVGKAPLHKMKPFGDRGAVIGVYCVARLSTGEHLSTIMSKAECDAIRDKCSKGSTSWKDFYEEMLKKTVIKRAAKLWPRSERLASAVDVSNENDGIDFNSKAPFIPTDSAQAPAPGENDFKELAKKLDAAKRTEGELLTFLSGKFKNDPPESIQAMNGAHMKEAIKALDSIIAREKKSTGAVNV